MKFTISATLLALLAVASGMVIEDRQAGGANANRPVPTGACCVPATSLKQDVCNVNGQTGRCVPANVNNCGGALTCIEDSRLTCDANTLERGRPLCRLAAGA
ncbi:hypothetical protein DL95DRAFT_517505 [Leptodontidium sp. 2 PMI_412]|nr:hypothetical protein BKA61DRAFT_668509 [Leptodontidium sp. MPI-SDFR-AT-0119]KAH9224313.1 hypothetical protein DL95DRAFT_517505 [Leptodontidium sp. 2 PMI_412]